MILMPQIFDVIANENARYKRNELELQFLTLKQRPAWLIVLARDVTDEPWGVHSLYV